MGLGPLIILLLLAQLAIVLVDLVVWPRSNLVILYAIPVLFGSLRLTPVQVTGIAAVAIVLDTLDDTVAHDPVRSWPITVPALVVISAFGVLIAVQRGEIARRAREADNARAQVINAHRNLQRFLGMVAHDLRAPLSALSGCVEVLQSDWRTTPPTVRRKAVNGIARTAQRIERLSTDLLDASRIGAGRFEIRPAGMDLVDAVREVVELHQSSLSGRQIILRSPARLDGAWDRERIIQVFTNLISNAIKYSDHGDIRVTIQKVGDKAVGCVTDEGIGMSPEQLAHLFDPFARLEREPGRTGTGLGLYITKGIVEAHQGRIWVDSQPGHGSTFFVELPLKSEPAVAEAGRNGLLRGVPILFRPRDD